MSKPKTVQLPTREDVGRFLAYTNRDSILAKCAPKHLQGITSPDDADACKRVYDWLRQIERGEWP